MARRKKRGKKERKLKKDLPIRPRLDPEVASEIGAIVLIAFALLLILAMFGVGGTAPHAIFHGLQILFGWTAYILPLLSLGLAWFMFQTSRYELKSTNYLGIAGIIITLCGLFHLPISQEDALVQAKNGAGGGVIGYLVHLGMLRVLNRAAAVAILLALLLIFVLLTTNISFAKLWRFLRGLIRPGEQEEFVVHGDAITNTKLPIRGTIGGDRPPAQQDFEPVTTGADPDWQGPGLDLLEETTTKPDAGNIKENAATIQSTLESFGIQVGLGDVNVGPTVTQYTIKPESGVKLNKITDLDRNLSLALAAHPLRIEAPIPGKSAVGIEIPNKKSAMVRMRDLINSDVYKKSRSPLEFVLGRDVSGEPQLADLAKMPHMLIAGATGSGKTVGINAFLMSLLFRNSPSDLKLILVDPKRVELTMYKDIPHLIAPVITEPKECVSALKWAVMEMESRYKLFAEEGKRNIGEYNLAKKGEGGMPYIVVVIDELADLMSVAAQEVEANIVRLAQMARATGIHLVLATQRPSVNVITGLIKANIPCRVAFTVASNVDSRTILDQGGAEKLLGSGDMLFISPEIIKPKRIQGAFVGEKEIKAVMDYLRKQREPNYNEEVLTQPVHMGARGGGHHDFDSGSSGDDELFQEAADTVIRSGKASASLLQRRLRVGYARAARLLDILEERGVIGPPDGARPRDVLVSSVDEASSIDNIEIEE